MWKGFTTAPQWSCDVGFHSSSCAPIITPAFPNYDLLNNHKHFIIPLLARIMCPCVLLPKANSKALQKVEDLTRNYQVEKTTIFAANTPVHPQAFTSSPSFFKRLLHELVESSRYDTRSDFTVVIQPFFREVILPRQPVSNEALSSTCWLHRLHSEFGPSDIWSNI